MFAKNCTQKSMGVLWGGGEVKILGNRGDIMRKI